MKVIISGGTGYIGNEVLQQCLAHPSITSVLILTRRPLPELASNPKAKVLVLSDFTSSYNDNPDLLAELTTSAAALWCLGTFHGDEKVDIDYPSAFIDTVKSTRPPTSTPFRYVQLGGAFTEPPPKEGEQQRSLWYYENGRRVRGKAEAKVLEADAGQFAVYLVKPGAVLPKKAALVQCVVGGNLSVVNDDLAATMVDLAVNGNEQRVFQCKDIVEHARTLGRKPS